MNRIKDAFDQVHADEKMIQSTSAKLASIRTNSESQVKPASSGIHHPKRGMVYRMAAVACAMLLVILLGGNYYSSETKAASYISVDSVPSIELTLNQKNKVIDANAYNDSGTTILNDLDLTGKDYQDAIELILERTSETSDSSNAVTFTVLSSNSDTEKGIVSSLSETSTDQTEFKVASVSEEDLLEEAHKCGMSLGKYNAYLALKEKDESITEEDCQHMSMEEIEGCEESCEDDSGEEDSCEKESCEEESCEEESHHSESEESHESHESHSGHCDD